jgi:hypothetical protein
VNWEAEYELLRAAYKGLAPTLREIAEQEKEEAKRRTKSRQDDVKVALAKEFRRYVEAGMPRYVIQKVLGTKDWNTYKEWVRLGDIPTATDIKAEKRVADSHFLWHDTTDPYTFDVVKDATGLTVTPVLAKVEAATPKDWQGKEDFFAEVPRGDYPEFGGFLAFQRYVNAEVKRAFEAGEIPEIISEYDALQRAKKNKNS